MSRHTIIDHKSVQILPQISQPNMPSAIGRSRSSMVSSESSIWSHSELKNCVQELDLLCGMQSEQLEREMLLNERLTEELQSARKTVLQVLQMVQTALTNGKFVGNDSMILTTRLFQQREQNLIFQRTSAQKERIICELQQQNIRLKVALQKETEQARILKKLVFEDNQRPTHSVDCTACQKAASAIYSHDEAYYELKSQVIERGIMNRVSNDGFVNLVTELLKKEQDQVSKLTTELRMIVERLQNTAQRDAESSLPVLNLKLSDGILPTEESQNITSSPRFTNTLPIQLTESGIFLMSENTNWSERQASCIRPVTIDSFLQDG